MNIKHTSSAERDLSGIIDRFLEVDPAAGVRWLDELERLEGLLADNPEMGRTTDVPGVRELVWAPDYLLPYVLDQDTIWILRIYYAGRDPAAKLP